MLYALASSCLTQTTSQSGCTLCTYTRKYSRIEYFVFEIVTPDRIANLASELLSSLFFAFLSLPFLKYGITIYSTNTYSRLFVAPFPGLFNLECFESAQLKYGNSPHLTVYKYQYRLPHQFSKTNWIESFENSAAVYIQVKQTNFNIY